MDKSLLDSLDFKTNTHGEIIVILFEKCNLSCQMCSQDHDSEVGMDSIPAKIQLVASSLSALKDKGKTSATVNLMGGELLADNIPDIKFEDYRHLIKEVRLIAESLEMPLEMHISTNLIFENVSRVKSFLSAEQIKLAVSYDPVGRFNPTTFEVFKSNLRQFKDYIKFVGSVMTRPSIDKFRSNNTPFFDYIYKNFTVIFDHYSPEQNKFIDSKVINFLMPSDVELREFYRFMLNTWPDCYPFKDMQNKVPQPLSCMSTITIKQNENVESCASYNLKSAGSEKVVTFFGNLNKLKDQWIEDYDCLSCKHMSYCQFGCFMNNHIKKIRTQEACWLQQVYDYVEETKNSVY